MTKQETIDLEVGYDVPAAIGMSVEDIQTPCLILDLDALERALRDGHIAGAGLDVIPEEPPREPIPSLLRAYRAQEEWLRGRLVITPHIAFHTPEAWDDIRRKSAETMRDVLVEGKRTNVIPPEAD